MKNLLLILTLVPSIVIAADEAQVTCDLAQSQATVSGVELKDPTAFAMFGDPSVQQKSVSVGLSESVSGFVRAGKLKRAADAQCDSAYASVKLEQYTLWSTADIQKQGAIASLSILNDAINLENENVKILSSQLSSNTATIIDFNSAESELEALQQQKTQLLTLISTVIPPSEYSNLQQLVTEYKADQGKAAELTAKASAHGGWDVSISAGEREIISGGTGTSPFITASVKYSFGTHAAMKAAEDVGRNTQLLLDSQQSGYRQSLDRHTKEVQSLIDIEATNVSFTKKQLEDLRRIRTPLDGVDSTLALNTKRALDIQIRALEAGLAGATVRLNQFKLLLVKM